MKDFFCYDTVENRKSLLARVRNVALRAEQHYDLAWERIQFIQLSDPIICFVFTPIVGARKKSDQNLFFLQASRTRK